MQIASEFRGIFPPMTTPFASDGELIESAVAEQVDWMITHGVDGLVAGGSTGEGHTLTADEHQALLAAVVKAAHGRAPVIAGLIVNSTREAVRRGSGLRHLGVAALQVTPVHYLFKPDADATVQHFRTIAEAVDLPILIYNVIPWNYLSPALMLRIMHEAPGVIGIKQSSGDLKSLSDLLSAANPRNRIFTAVDALLYSSYCLGAHGSICAVDSAVPGITVKLWHAVQHGDHATALALHRGINNLWNAMTHENLPACVKFVQSLQGLSLHEVRAPMHAVPRPQRQAIEAALSALLG